MVFPRAVFLVLALGPSDALAIDYPKRSAPECVRAALHLRAFERDRHQPITARERSTLAGRIPTRDRPILASLHRLRLIDAGVATPMTDREFTERFLTPDEVALFEETPLALTRALGRVLTLSGLQVDLLVQNEAMAISIEGRRYLAYSDSHSLAARRLASAPVQEHVELRPVGALDEQPEADFQLSSSQSFSSDVSAIVVTRAEGHGQSREHSSLVWNPHQNTLTPLEEQESLRDALVSPTRSSVLLIPFGRKPRLVDATNGALLHELGDQAAGVGRYSSDGRKVFTIEERGIVRMWSVATGDCLHAFTQAQGSPALSIDVSPSGTQLIMNLSRSNSEVWDTQTGQFSYQLPGGLSRFSHDGTRIFSAGRTQNGGISVINAHNAAVVRHIPNPVQGVRSLQSSHTGNFLLMYAAQNRVSSWDLSTGEPIYSRSWTSDIEALELHPNGRFVIVMLKNGEARIADARTFTHIADIPKYWLGIRGAWFSADGRYLVTLHEHSVIRVAEVVITEHITESDLSPR